MYCHHCGKVTKEGSVVCDECKEKGISDEQTLDNTYIEQLDPDELDFRSKGPALPIKGKGIASMVLGIVALGGLLFQIMIPGGLITLLVCSILALVFSRLSHHTKGKKYGNVGTITGILAIVLICIEVVMLIIGSILFILIVGLNSIIAILTAILGVLAILINLIVTAITI